MAILQLALVRSPARQAQAQRPVCSDAGHAATPLRPPLSSAHAPFMVEAKRAGPAAIRIVAAAASAPDVGSTTGSSAQTSSAKAEVLRLLGIGVSKYDASPDMAAAVEHLIQENPSQRPGPDSIRLGQGVWEVFYAPHIVRMSSVLGTRFEPLRYTLSGSRLHSNVYYSSPLLGKGWLSAAGDFGAAGEADTKLKFDRFWVDRGEEPLRDNLDKGEERQWDKVITAVGRVGFLEGLAKFPVLYLDEDLTVFRFPPLGVNIAARRMP